MSRTKYIRRLDQVDQLTDGERLRLAKVVEKYKFRANDYYLGLIDWDDPEDPIRRIIIPDTGELIQWGDLDASDEDANYVAPGCQHKYPHTALLLCNEVCGAYCRFCFRKRLFMDENDEAVIDVSEGIEYIRRTPRITNVLLTGGDPLLMSTRRLDDILKRLRRIDHVGIIRIGTKMPAVNPFRIIDNPDLLEMLSRYSTRHKRVYIMTHFNVPQELTEAAVQACDMLRGAGVICANQTPLLRGINDDPCRLAELMRRLSFIGVPPYYFFQCRPTEGNKIYDLPLVDSYMAFVKAKKQVSGLAKRARYVMSDASGKIEMVGLTRHHIYMRYHRAKLETDEERFMIFHRDDDAYWLDDLVPVDRAPHPVSRFGHRPTHALGPE
ncbi:MAG: KamA family radical SAM protein [Candidatus Zixiibacteriota bacterium]|nr:MAG: KamA family radical SAM protein [candidate division Zixibacteria bacterium]